jgi:hypothetical protein
LGLARSIMAENCTTVLENLTAQLPYQRHAMGHA